MLTVRKQSSGLFFYLSMLTLLFLVLEICLVIQCSGIYLGDMKLISHHLKIPATILPGVTYFVMAQLVVHAVYLILIALITVFFARACNIAQDNIGKTGIALWLLGTVTVLLINRVYFVNSKYATILLGILPIGVAKGLLIVLGVSWILIGFAVFVGLMKWFRANTWKMNLQLSMAVLGGFALFYGLSDHRVPTLSAATVDKPNIIIIGVDSLRPDFLGYFGYVKQTPHFDRFLNQATVFANAITPLARTYPSWVSIMTGLYPKVSGIRTNLFDQSKMDYSQTLPSILQKNGYETIFAMDETRFSNIDKRFGFDHVVTPPIGFNDFFLGTLNDFPLSNLIINTSMGRVLFPHSYASRPVYVTYEPDSFLHLLEPVLSGPKLKPIFMITHFCLPHYPYAWEDFSADKVTMHHYQVAVQRVDRQFDGLMRMLHQQHLLDHSIVILLSDHGEAVELAGDRVTDPDLYIPGVENKLKIIPHFYPPTATKEAVNQAGGHGTDVLSVAQYHTVLAFRTFGLPANAVRAVPGLVSLLDVKPTLLDYLHIKSQKLSGVSLLNVVMNRTQSVPMQKDFFVESDFSPEAIRSVHPETRKVLFEGIDFFRIDPVTTRLVVRDSMYKLILSSKQYADYSGHWVLALYPQKHHSVQPILVNLVTGEWTDDLSTPFAQKSPAHSMLKAMRAFYGKDIYARFTQSMDYAD